MRPLWTLFLCQFVMAWSIRAGACMITGDQFESDGFQEIEIAVTTFKETDQGDQQEYLVDGFRFGGRSDHLRNLKRHLSGEEPIIQTTPKLEKDHKDYNRPVYKSA
jgi:hypothetical protein